MEKNKFTKEELENLYQYPPKDFENETEFQKICRIGRNSLILELIEKSDIPDIMFDIHKYLSIMENYLKGEHNKETDDIQKNEDWKLYQETIRLKELISNRGI